MSNDISKPKKGRRKFTFAFFTTLILPFTKLLFNYKYERIPKIDGPIILLCNHTTDCDCGFVAAAARRPIRFVATENVARMGLLGKILMFLFEPILHYKGAVGIGTVKQILQAVKDGQNVGLFPEGNRTFNGITCPIPSSTAKMIRSSGATLVNYKLSGGYFTTPRWGRKIRKGMIKGSISGIYPPETLRSMTNEEVKNIIEKDLYVDAYAEQKLCPIRYKNKNRAEYLESTLFMCPKCHKIGTLISSGCSIRCTDCNYLAEYTEYGYVLSEGVEKTITELDAAQHEYIKQLTDMEHSKPLFGDKVILKEIDNNHAIVSEKECEVKAWFDRFELGDNVIDFEDIEGIAINQRNLLLINVKSKDTHFEVSSDGHFSALKYLYLVRTVSNSKNGVL